MCMCSVLVGVVSSVAVSLVGPVKQIMSWFWQRRLVIPLKQQSHSINPPLVFWKTKLWEPQNTLDGTAKHALSFTEPFLQERVQMFSSAMIYTVSHM